MGVQEVLSRKTGVIVGDDVLRLFEYAQEKTFAIPAVVSRHDNTVDGEEMKERRWMTDAAAG